jgi:hypothetical protein
MTAATGNQFKTLTGLSAASVIGIISMMLPPVAVLLGTVLFAQRVSSFLRRRLSIERKGISNGVRSFRNYLNT